MKRTPPCQAGCPSGHDVRGWLAIARGQELPLGGMSWQEAAFRRMTEANPFPALMGRVCPALCQTNCNRNSVEEHVGINAIEHYVGDYAIRHKLTFPQPEVETGKKIAIVGGGPAGLACAYQLRRRGHSPTIFEANAALGGMLRYGLSRHRCPRDIVDAEIQRILDMGVKVRLNTRVGYDISVKEVEQEFDAVFWGIGAQGSSPLPVPGGEASNCVAGLTFLRAANTGRLKYLTGRILVIGGGDTAMDCASVAQRLGNIKGEVGQNRADSVLSAGADQPDVSEDAIGPADTWIVYRRPISMAPAAKEEIDFVMSEGVEIHEGLAPVEVVHDDTGRATALRVVKTDWSTGKMVIQEGTEFDIPCDLIVVATGQNTVFEGIEEMDSGRGQIDADSLYRVPERAGHFVGGDAIAPRLLTTAIGHAWKAAESIDRFIRNEALSDRPAVDVSPLHAGEDGPGLRGPFGHGGHRGRRAVRRPLPVSAARPPRTPADRPRRGSRQLRGAAAHPYRRAGAGRGRALHVLRHLPGMQQLRGLLPAETRSIRFPTASMRWATSSRPTNGIASAASCARTSARPATSR